MADEERELEAVAGLVGRVLGPGREQIVRWARQQVQAEDGELEDRGAEGPVRLVLHPGCEPLELAPLGPEAWSFRAGTLSGGAGYHARVAEALEALAQQGARLEVRDPTGWWERREPLALEDAVRRWWLLAGARAARRAELAGRPVLFGLPADHAAPDVRGARVVTPLAIYRVPAWREALAQIARGDDPAQHVPWWAPERDAAWWRNLARAWLARAAPAGLGAQRRRLERIAAAAEQAARLDPKIALPHAALADVHEALEQPERMIEHLEAALARQPAHHGLRRRLVAALLEAGRWAQAAGHLERLAQARERDHALAFDAARVLIEAGEPERALPLLERAIALAPRNPAYHGERAVALAACGRLEEALEANAAALALAPDDPLAREHRERILAALGRSDGSLSQPRHGGVDVAGGLWQSSAPSNEAGREGKA